MSHPISVIAINTFRELVRGKAIYAVCIAAAATVCTAALFGSVSVGDQLLVVKDFGLFSISAYSVAFAVIAGASLLHKELSRKTVFNILSKPVERWHFVFGKFIGILAVELLLIFFLACSLSIFCTYFSPKWDWAIAGASGFIFLEVTIVCAAALFFSSLVVTPALNGIFTLGLFLAGRSVGYLKLLLEEGFVSGVAAKVVKAVYFLLPQLEKINISNEAAFGSLPSVSLASSALLYTLAYSLSLLTIACILFRRRDFN